MSFPNEVDAIVIKVGDGASPQVFTVICGADSGQLNESVQSNDRYRRDCAKPGKIPARRVRVTGKSWDLSVSGVVNIDQIELLSDNLGISRDYQIVGIKYDGSDSGETLGTWAGSGVATSNNKNFAEGGTMELAIAGENELVWTPAS